VAGRDESGFQIPSLIQPAASAKFSRLPRQCKIPQRRGNFFRPSGDTSLQPLIDRLASENLVTLLPASKTSETVYDNLNTPQDFARMFSSKSSI
jgi:hypothetical protein